MMRNYSRIDAFLNDLASDIYPEVPTLTHNDVTDQIIAAFVSKGIFKPGMTVLDVGCGQGVALRRLTEAGLIPLGIAIGNDVEICWEQGFMALKMDMSFMSFDGKFDVIWARHVLEHSIFPLFTLVELKLFLKPGGVLYVEVPSPDTFCNHETNQNHYSVMGVKMWQALFKRAGFTLVDACKLDVPLPDGVDTYYGFHLTV